MTKLKMLSIRNFRGSKQQVDLISKDLKSILLYGDNGTGKSSFTDAAEWLFKDKVSHLSGSEEVETNGGLRNSLCPESEDCFVQVEFVNPSGTARKALRVEKGKFKADLSTSDDTIKSLISELQNEMLLLRNSELVRFILGRKSDRLKEISEIIGFDVVVQTKTILKTALGQIKKIINIKNFQNALAVEGETVLKQLETVVNTEDQFLNACNKLLGKLNMNLTVTSRTDLENVEKKLREGVDEKEVQRYQNLESLKSAKESVMNALSEAKVQWEAFVNRLNEIQSDRDRLKKIDMAKLLDEAEKILTYHDQDNCPVCLQVISREDLKELISQRIKELQDLKNEIQDLEATKKLLCSKINDALELFRKFCSDSRSVGDETATNNLFQFGIHLKEVHTELTETEAIKSTKRIDWSRLDQVQQSISILLEKATTQSQKMKAVLNSPRVEVAQKLALAKEAFSKMTLLIKESEILNSQRDSLDRVVLEINERQKVGMEAFLKSISDDLNDLYVFMNNDEKVDDVKLVPLVDKENEFTGVAVSLKFHGQEVPAPRKYLSESYVNSLGLCLFLASVRKFNRKSGFFILDDVISSFDKNHRIRFGQLLAEKFSDYQVIVLTHETEWYEYLSSLVKGMGWSISRTHWTTEEGCRLEIPSVGLKEQILRLIKAGNENDLGNSIRRFSERLLKEICEALEIPLPFRFNEKNEARVFDELYSALKGKLAKKSPAISEKPEFKRLATCQFLSNKSSHDNTFKPNIADMKIAFEDLKIFEQLFRCVECSKLVSLNFSDIPGNRISCRCGKNTIEWAH